LTQSSTFLNRPSSVPPSAATVAAITAAMRAMISPYSTAVAPRSLKPSRARALRYTFGKTRALL